MRENGPAPSSQTDGVVFALHVMIVKGYFQKSVASGGRFATSKPVEDVNNRFADISRATDKGKKTACLLATGALR